MEGNFETAQPIKKQTNQDEKKGLSHNQKEKFNSAGIMNTLDSTWQNRGIFLKEFFKGFDDKVEDLMRVILKIQNDIQKLIDSSEKSESKEFQKSSQFENLVELVCIDFKFITLQAKIFESQMNEYQTKLNNFAQSSFAKENIQTELNGINYLNDIQKAIFDNYFDPSAQQLQDQKHENPSSNPIEESCNTHHKQCSQINSDQNFQETITPNSNNMVQQSRSQTINQANRIESEYLNSLETPTESGDSEDVREKNLKEEEKDGLQKNKNTIEEDKTMRQLKRRYSVQQKIEIVKEITSKTFYQEKKIIPKMFLAKYQICYQTLQNWIKKYHEKQYE